MMPWDEDDGEDGEDDHTIDCESQAMLLQAE